MARSTKFMALLAVGLSLAAAPALAQDTNEEVHVTAPHFHGADHLRLNGTLQKVSLSDAVSYSDLDLRSRRDARELRLRVRDKAQEICTEIAEAYPVRQANGTSCYKDALQDGLIHANEAIADARSYND